MGAIDSFLRRFGYAKLNRYGLIMTADDRVLSNRPAVLDDGLGSKIVGWTDDDLAAMELDHWGAAKKAAAAIPVAAPKSLHRPAPPAVPLAAKVIAPAVKLPGLTPMVAAPVAAPVAPPVTAPVVVAAPPPVVVAKAPVVAAEPEPVEDEWEWEIAVARARAAAEWAAEEAAQAAASISTSVTAPPKRKTSPGIPAVRAKTEPPVRSMPTPVRPIERKTVIPVPQLTTVARASDLLPYTPSAPPRRTPRGTGPISEDTVRTQAAPVANDDTTPYITLPNEVKPVGYAHTKRVAAKQR